jgi:hypothetical protein
VVDNTNPTVADRARYVAPARAAGFKVVGYLVDASPGEALAGNAQRSRRVPEGGVVATARRFIRPAPEEGFDELWHAVAVDGAFRVEPLASTEPLF